MGVFFGSHRLYLQRTQVLDLKGFAPHCSSLKNQHGERLVLTKLMVQPHRILLVEENISDASLLQKGFEKCSFPVQVSTANAREEAKKMLGSASSRLPDLILLGLDQPSESDWEWLVALKNQKSTKAIPVLVLLQAKTPHDYYTAYHHKANCCISKPADPKDFETIAQAIGDFWLSIIELPSRKSW